MGQRAAPFDRAKLPQPGAVLAGKYRIERLLGKGGMGAVFLAHHELLYQHVAIKLLHATIARDPEVLQRFHNEARAAARIHSEHVARVMDIGALDDGSPFMVLEYLEGTDLARLVKQRGALPATEAVDYIVQAIEAVAQAHALGIIHRDLKPANLFVASRVDGGSILKVLDFGISKATSPFGPAGPLDGGMTSTKAMLGSPFYMSPEQLRSARNVDTRTDIWALGIVLHELLAGQRPFRGENFGELFASILEEDAPSLSTIRGDIPVELEVVVGRCLRRKPDQRFSNVGQLALELAQFATPSVSGDLERIRKMIPQLPSPEATAAAAAARRSAASIHDVAPDLSDTAHTPASRAITAPPSRPGAPTSGPAVHAPAPEHVAAAQGYAPPGHVAPAPGLAAAAQRRASSPGPDRGAAPPPVYGSAASVVSNRTAPMLHVHRPAAPPSPSADPAPLERGASASLGSPRVAPAPVAFTFGHGAPAPLDPPPAGPLASDPYDGSASPPSPDSATTELPRIDAPPSPDPASAPGTTTGAWSELQAASAMSRRPIAIVAGVTFSAVLLVGSIGAALLWRMKSAARDDLAAPAAAHVRAASSSEAPLASASTPPVAAEPPPSSSVAPDAVSAAPSAATSGAAPAIAAASGSSGATPPVAVPSDPPAHVDAAPRPAAKPAAPKPKIDPFGSRHL